MANTKLSREAVLELVPQQPPMRFIDEILELDQDHIETAYTWLERDCEGHFPGRPIVPGVKLVECACQAALTAWGIFHLSFEMPAKRIKSLVGLFSRIESVDFMKLVVPGDRVVVRGEFGENGYARNGKLVTEAAVFFADGREGEILRARFSGMWLPASSVASEPGRSA
jgi:3-hydroxyacyl-[acyl-carrier-protein] dehydratase